MCLVILWGIELKVGMGVGDGPTRFLGIFSKRPHLGSKVIQRSICLKNALWLPNLVERTPDHSVVHCWGQRSCQGHLGSTRGQIAQQYPMATKFGGKNPWPKHNELLPGQRSCRGQLGSSRGQFVKQWPMATKFDGKNPWPQHLINYGVKGHVGVNLYY